MQKSQIADLAVVTVNWNRPEDTVECIQSILDSGVSSSQMIVVDNGSTDGSYESILDSFPKINLIRLPENLGFAGGFNTGVKSAQEMGMKQIFLINNDAIVEPDTITHLIASPWDIAVPKILFYDEPLRIWAAGSRWRHFPPSVVMRGYRKLDGERYSQEQALEYATGCALLVRKEVFSTVGGFDPLFESYLEDYDFCYRATQAGYALGYCPHAKVYHKVSASLGERSPKRWWYLGRNIVLFFRKDRRFPFLLLWEHLAWVTLREIFKGNLPRLRIFWRGVFDGFNQLSNFEKQSK